MKKINNYFNSIWEYFQKVFTLKNCSLSSYSFSKVETNIFLLEKREKTQYYFIKNNIWPFLLSLAIALILLKIVFFLHDQSFFGSFLINTCIIFLFVFSGYGWFKNLNNESLFENEHTLFEKKNLVQGFLFFILIEFMTFAACFWVLFHSGLAPSIWIGAIWPAEGVVSVLVNEDIILHNNYNRITHFFDGEPCTVSYNSAGFIANLCVDTVFNSDSESFKVHINLFDKGQLINPYKVPLMNTFILLTSAATITISHKSLKLERYFFSAVFLFLTIVLGIIFVKVQYLEYVNSMVSGHDGIYGNVFFAITGLHGLHVIMGLIFLFVCLINLVFKKYSLNFHRSFEFAIWYWHFVDVIWIFVYFLLYLWPASFFFKEDMSIWTISENYYCINLSVDAYREILYLNYLKEIKNPDANLNWIAENVQNYNMQLIRRDIDHFHFFLEMTREHIIAKVRLHRYMEETKIESIFLFILLFLNVVYSDFVLLLFLLIGVIVWFKTDGFNFMPFLKQIYNELLLIYLGKKNKNKIFLEISDLWKNFFISKLKLFNKNSIFECIFFFKTFIVFFKKSIFLENVVFNQIFFVLLTVRHKWINAKNADLVFIRAAKNVIFCANSSNLYKKIYVFFFKK